MTNINGTNYVVCVNPTKTDNLRLGEIYMIEPAIHIGGVDLVTPIKSNGVRLQSSAARRFVPYDEFVADLWGNEKLVQDFKKKAEAFSKTIAKRLHEAAYQTARSRSSLVNKGYEALLAENGTYLVYDGMEYPEHRGEAFRKKHTPWVQGEPYIQCNELRAPAKSFLTIMQWKRKYTSVVDWQWFERKNPQLFLKPGTYTATIADVIVSEDGNTIHMDFENITKEEDKNMSNEYRVIMKGFKAHSLVVDESWQQSTLPHSFNVEVVFRGSPHTRYVYKYDLHADLSVGDTVAVPDPSGEMNYSIAKVVAINVNRKASVNILGVFNDTLLTSYFDACTEERAERARIKENQIQVQREITRLENEAQALATSIQQQTMYQEILKNSPEGRELLRKLEAAKARLN